LVLLLLVLLLLTAQLVLDMLLELEHATRMSQLGVRLVQMLL
jgi:hypothetical protein